MKSFLGEIKRRKVFQVAVAYAVVAWIIVQVVAVVSQPLRLPDWFGTAVIVLLVAGFAVALVLAWVLEGSVRYAGDRVRVTAQLIDAATEEHLWSEVYERHLADVFAIQADIAEQIAAALKAELSATERENIEALPMTVSTDAHALYLQSQALFAQGDTAIAATTPPALRVRPCAR